MNRCSVASPVSVGLLAIPDHWFIWGVYLFEGVVSSHRFPSVWHVVVSGYLKVGGQPVPHHRMGGPA